MIIKKEAILNNQAAYTSTYSKWEVFNIQKVILFDKNVENVSWTKRQTYQSQIRIGFLLFNQGYDTIDLEMANLLVRETNSREFQISIYQKEYSYEV